MKLFFFKKSKIMDLHGLKELVNVCARTNDFVDLVELLEGEALPLNRVILKKEKRN